MRSLYLQYIAYQDVCRVNADACMPVLLFSTTEERNIYLRKYNIAFPYFVYHNVNILNITLLKRGAQYLCGY